MLDLGLWQSLVSGCSPVNAWPSLSQGLSDAGNASYDAGRTVVRPPLPTRAAEGRKLWSRLGPNAHVAAGSCRHLPLTTHLKAARHEAAVVLSVAIRTQGHGVCP